MANESQNWLSQEIDAVQAKTDLNIIRDYLRKLIVFLNRPLWLNPASSYIRGVDAVTTVTTVTTVATVTGITNIGGFAANTVVFNLDRLQWQNSVRNRIA